LLGGALVRLNTILVAVRFDCAFLDQLYRQNSVIIVEHFVGVCATPFVLSRLGVPCELPPPPDKGPKFVITLDHSSEEQIHDKFTKLPLF